MGAIDINRAQPHRARWRTARRVRTCVRVRSGLRESAPVCERVHARTRALRHPAVSAWRCAAGLWPPLRRPRARRVRGINAAGCRSSSCVRLLRGSRRARLASGATAAASRRRSTPGGCSSCGLQECFPAAAAAVARCVPVGCGSLQRSSICAWHSGGCGAAPGRTLCQSPAGLQTVRTRPTNVSGQVSRQASMCAKQQTDHASGRATRTAPLRSRCAIELCHSS